ncbi:3-oxoacyl-[acyl-carrier-protein] reductase FabG [compost metagenome]
MSGAYSAERREAAIRSIPVKRAGTVQDIANAVGFLASGATGFINGAVLDVNGGGFM